MNRRIAPLGLLTLVALLVGAGVLLANLWSNRGRTIETSIVAPEKPIVMHTRGGMLEVATVRALERITRRDSKDFWGLDLGTTVSQIQAPVVYRYQIAMAREWPLSIRDGVCIVRAADIQAALPVAFDTSLMEKYTRSGWARFNKMENMELLERSITPALAARAQSASYRDLARVEARKAVAEFVTIWLLKEQGWSRGPTHKVIVLFPGEKL